MTGEKYITVETLMATTAVVWGGWAAYPYQSLFDRQPQLYGPLLFLCGGSETLAGMVFMTAGLLTLFFWFTDRRLVAGAIITLIYGLFASLYLVGDATSPAWLMWFVFTAGNFIHLLFRWKN